MADFVNTIDLLGDDAVVDSIIDKSITEFNDDVITLVGTRAFHGCALLTAVNMPNTQTLDEHCFSGCSSLETVILPECIGIGKLYPNSWFADCTSLKRITLPKVTNLAINGTFTGCKSLEYVDLPLLTKLSGATQFRDCKVLTMLILRRTEGIVTLGTTGSFSGTPIQSGTGYIYVPRDLIEDYKAATNWSTFASQFRALEDYTVDGTVTGELLTTCSAITLDKTELTFSEHGSYALTATTIPADFIGRSISWSSDNQNVATVDSNGMVTIIFNGTATITATCGNQSASCTITVSGLEKPKTLYSLPEAKTFNGTSDYIDTGVQLFDEPKNFTIICKAEFGKLAANKTMFHCMRESSPYPGLSLDGNNGARICYTTGQSVISAPNNITTLILRYKAGILDDITYKNPSGVKVSVVINGNLSYTTITQNLLLGAYQNNSGAKGRYFAGTISAFDVFEACLSDVEIDALLSRE